MPSLCQTGAFVFQKFDVGYFPFDPGRSSRKWLPTKHFLQICPAGIVLSRGTGNGGTEGKEISVPVFCQDTERKRKLHGVFHQPPSLDISAADLATKLWREMTPHLGDIWDGMQSFLNL